MIEFTTGLLMIASAFSPAPAQANASTIPTSIVKDIASASTTATTSEAAISLDSVPHGIVQTEAYVREYYKDAPILAEIARCESEFRQYDGKTGKVLVGMVDPADTGVMQINSRYHEEDALKLGLDIYTLKGNLEFAKVLYGKFGSKPWSSSSKCWGKSVPSQNQA